MVVTARGEVSATLAVGDSIAKNGRGRRLPVHPELATALKLQHKHLGKPRSGPVIPSRYGRNLKPRSIVNWFRTIYDELGLQGCSSHSGRRTFITRAARSVHKVGGSLEDVQELAGHSSLTTTEAYIAGDRDAQRRLVRLL
jgi:integrase/recombinase XerD